MRFSENCVMYVQKIIIDYVTLAVSWRTELLSAIKLYDSTKRVISYQPYDTTA
jgi:hypothetical protein